MQPLKAYKCNAMLPYLYCHLVWLYRSTSEALQKGIQYAYNMCRRRWYAKGGRRIQFRLKQYNATIDHAFIKLL